MPILDENEEVERSRYLEEFEESEQLGSGNFCVTYKCRNRLDGKSYAIKRAENACMEMLTRDGCCARFLLFRRLSMYQTLSIPYGVDRGRSFIYSVGVLQWGYDQTSCVQVLAKVKQIHRYRHHIWVSRQKKY